MQKIKQFLYLVKPFWCSSASKVAWLLLLSVIVLSLSTVWFNVKLNQWNGDFYNALQTLNGQILYRLLGDFIVLIVIMILVVVYADYLQKKLLIIWRHHMTEKITKQWLSKHSHHYHLKCRQDKLDNPDQRIAEDVYLLIKQSLDLLLSFLRSCMTLISFTTILWTLSGAISFTLLSMDIYIPGYMVFVCLIYTLLGVICTHAIGKPLHKINVEKQRSEADYRAALIYCHQSSEAIAGQHGEKQETARLQNKFTAIIHNWQNLMNNERNLSFFSVGYQQVSSLAPIFFALPAFIAGLINLGGLMQIRQAFMQVSSALSWFIYAYRDIAIWQATVTRLYHFIRLLDELPENTIIPSTNKDKLLDAQVVLRSADNQQVLLSTNIELAKGDTLLLQGLSGIGKSTLLKAISGFWANYQGVIQRTDNYLWIPQKIWLSYDRLDNLLTYPACPQSFARDALIETLSLVGLDKLNSELETEDDWSNRLSGGEQQRLMFARLLLNKPDLILLDEVTSALDLPSVYQLISLLQEKLPESAVIFVSHQPIQNYVKYMINLDTNVNPSSQELAKPNSIVDNVFVSKV
ncbi:ABC transporter ATP-binding protein/permease [Gilliamella mensalis]|uniref:ABC transporter ATP-binding protein/permease n=1 Tax=Gilliamella mensalis TaxID=1908520 RepID=UPI000A149777|nr:ABC transporter ATP-binding protein/permease [Gilliamella mensalis]